MHGRYRSASRHLRSRDARTRGPVSDNMPSQVQSARPSHGVAAVDGLITCSATAGVSARRPGRGRYRAALTFPTVDLLGWNVRQIMVHQHRFQFLGEFAHASESTSTTTPPLSGDHSQCSICATSPALREARPFGPPAPPGSSVERRLEDDRFRRQSPKWNDCLPGEEQLWVRHVGSSPLSLRPRP